MEKAAPGLEPAPRFLPHLLTNAAALCSNNESEAMLETGHKMYDKRASRRDGFALEALDRSFVALEDDEDGITYVLSISRADMESALQLARNPHGNLSLPSIGGSAVAAGEFVCLSYRDASGQGTIVVDPAQLRHQLMAALASLNATVENEDVRPRGRPS
ncbi:hypothetical protein [Niveibacterium sp. SC-1]|uniref:hypothetical protein n=1 Tax=Niveibacterium sp. SC-1 TaxID=3135646 RepID=UPI00311D9C90